MTLFCRYDWGRSAFKDGQPRKASEESYVEAVVGAFDMAAARFPELPVAIWGQSLGTGAACALAERRPRACALVLQSPLLSCLKVLLLLVSTKPTLSHQVLQVASLSLPSLWGADLFVSWKRAPHIVMPSLVMHGARDEVRFVSFDLSPCF